MSTTMSAGTHARRTRPDFRRSRTADDCVHRAAAERQVKPCNVSRLVFDGATVCPGHRAASHGFTGGLLAVSQADRTRVTSPNVKSAPVEHPHNYDPNRLREYRWKTERDIRRETPEAADRFYKYTYGTAQCSSVALNFPERTIDGHRLRTRLRSLQRAATAESAHSDPALANITSGRILERLRELEQMRHPAAVVDSLPAHDGHSHRTEERADETLYSQVAHSIGLFSHGAERTRTANSRLRGGGSRPAEYASTPRILSAAPLSARSRQSSDAYLGYLEGQTASRPPADAGTAWDGQPGAVYNPAAAESRLVQMVADCNTPGGAGTGSGNANAPEVASSDPQTVNSEHCAVSGVQPPPDTSHDDKTSSEEHVTSEAKAVEGKPPKNGLRKAATVAPPPRRHKSSTVRVACRPVVKKELTIVVPMV